MLLILFQSSSELRDGIVLRIKSLGSWARITDEAYAVKCGDKSAEEVRDELSDAFRAGARFLVMEIPDLTWSSYNLPKKVTDWLKNR